MTLPTSTLTIDCTKKFNGNDLGRIMLNKLKAVDVSVMICISLFLLTMAKWNDTISIKRVFLQILMGRFESINVH